MYYTNYPLVFILLFLGWGIHTDVAGKTVVSPIQQGCVKGNCENGTGIYVYPNGDIYQGKWLSNKRHGLGTITYEGTPTRKGDIYDGEWQGNRRHGRGAYSWANGDLYEGDWKNDRMFGRGKFYKSNGEWYEGEWEGNVKKGRGTYKYNATPQWKEHFYVGQWSDDEPCCAGEFRYIDGKVFSKEKKTDGSGCKMGDCQNGYGEYQYAVSRRYEGTWRNGRFDGEGTFFYETGEKYIGNWTTNKRDGEGQFYSKSGELIYDGNWKDDVQNGYGIYHYQNGTRYAGQWTNGVREGKGRFTIPKVGYYEGEFQNDRFNGEGVFYYADRSRYEGIWKDNVKDGQGKEYNPQGKIYREGNWEEGNFVE